MQGGTEPKTDDDPVCDCKERECKRQPCKGECGCVRCAQDFEDYGYDD